MTDYEKACAEVETPNYNFDHETAINFEKGSKVATATTCEYRLIKKIKKYAEDFPEKFQICSEKNGTIVAHIPSGSIKIIYSEPKHREMSEEQKQIFLENVKRGKEKRQNASNIDNL